jgi:hypothetical protein
MTIMSRAELIGNLTRFQEALNIWTSGLVHSIILATNAEPYKVYRVDPCYGHICRSANTYDEPFYGILTELHTSEYNHEGGRQFALSFGFKIFKNYAAITNKSEGMARLFGYQIKAMTSVTPDCPDLTGMTPEEMTFSWLSVKHCTEGSNRGKQLKAVYKLLGSTWGKMYLEGDLYRYLDVSLAPLLMADAPDLAKLILNKGA